MQGAQGQFFFIPFPAGGYDIAIVHAISGDAKTITGYADKSGVANSRSGWYWNEVSGTSLIPNLPGYSQMEPFDINFDGSVIVGKQRVSDAMPTETAFRWESGVGTTELTPTGTSPGGGGWGVSDDGLRVVGRNDNSNGGFLWKSGTGLIALEHPADITPVTGLCLPMCISGDGTVIGGRYNKTVLGVNTIPAAFWSGDDGSFLGVVSGPSSGCVMGLTYDGTVGVGTPNDHRFESGFCMNISRSGKVIAGNSGAGANKYWLTSNGGASTVQYASAGGFIRRPNGGDEIQMLQGLVGASDFVMADDGVVYALNASNGTQQQGSKLTMLVQNA